MGFRNVNDKNERLFKNGGVYDIVKKESDHRTIEEPKRAQIPAGPFRPAAFGLPVRNENHAERICRIMKRIILSLLLTLSLTLSLLPAVNAAGIPGEESCPARRATALPTHSSHQRPLRSPLTTATRRRSPSPRPSTAIPSWASKASTTRRATATPISLSARLSCPKR